ncbi:MAG: PVC-type heme-binding CxxCH protein [Phycisphaerales bacterium]
MLRFIVSAVVGVFVLLSPSIAAGAAAAPPMAVQRGDHIAIIGNALADRMQHSGSLETFIHASHPEAEIVVRHLGFAGDEIDTRMRSDGFGSPDEWLTKVEADVILAFFGYNESFAGAEGLDAFRALLDGFITHTLEQRYNGGTAPRLVLFSPIAAEDHADPNFRDPAELNPHLKLYTEAMREVAEARRVPFVDLYSISQTAYDAADEPLTVNGVHLTEYGYHAIASAMYRAIFGESAPLLESERFGAIRDAVNEKNALWFSRYRTVDGYNIYGGRSHLEYEGIRNRDTMQREMEMRDVMTRNAERRVWWIAQGRDLAFFEAEPLPAPIAVPTNKPGELPGGEHAYLSGEAAIAKMKVPPGLEVNLFASEERFPELANPVQMAFDTKGRLWVASWPNYPERTPDSERGDSLLIFEDHDNDGRADECITFVDDLNAPTGFQFYRDGVLLVQAPDVWFLRDTDGDDRADWKRRVLNGLDSADSHHTANSLVLDPGGAVYLSDGVFHRTQVETPWGPPVRNYDGAIYRYEPRTSKFDRYIAYGFANPHGRVFTRWGNDLVTDATGNHTYFGPAFSGHLDFPHKHSGLRQFWERPSRPCPGTGILSSRHFPEEFQDNFLDINVIGFQGIYRVEMEERGSGVWGTTIEPPLVKSDDPNFRPTAVDVAPDGSVYFLDWHNAIIGHMQHHLRDPSRDHAHGRIYRITHKDRPLLDPPAIAGAPVSALLDLLTAPENNTRTRAKIELGARDTDEVIDALGEWIEGFEFDRVEDQHALTEALWVHQWHNVVNEPLLERMLESPEPRARAAAVRVLCYWRDRMKDPLALLRVAAEDPSPRVRHEVVRAASFFEGPEAMAVAHAVLRHEMDYYLDYTFNETVRQLERTIDEPWYPEDDATLAALVERMSDAKLLEAPRQAPVLEERLARPGLNMNVRTDALVGLAQERGATPVAVGVRALRRIDESERFDDAAAADDLGFLLAAHTRAMLEAERAALVDLALNGSKEATRRGAFAAVLAADGGPERARSLVDSRPERRVELIESIRLLADVKVRAACRPLIDEALADPASSSEIRAAGLRGLPLMPVESAGDSFARLATHLREGPEMTAAATAILQLPREAWKPEPALGAARAIAAWAADIPAAERTSGEVTPVIQAGLELATSAAAFDEAAANATRAALLDLGVRVFTIRSVREQMRYDTTELVVEAGEAVEIHFENADMMPHNIIFVEPGSRESIGRAADAMEPTLDAQGRQYVPDDDRIFAASKMIEPGQSTTIRFEAPATPGVYEYVCTFPEHWMTMYGTLIVVADMDAYVQDGAASETPDDRLTLEGTPGLPGNGKRIVLVSGDEEYRSEQALPMLAKILSQRHGFDCVVLFAWTDDYIDPNNQSGMRGLDALDDADLMLISTRFRRPTAEQAAHLTRFLNAGKPVIGLRTATHAFTGAGQFGEGDAAISYDQFGRRVLGEQWVNHHGHHGVEGTRGVVEEAHADHPILRGVEDIFAPTDVYGVDHLTDEDTILLRGGVTATLDPASPLVENAKNDPMEPLAWLHEYTAPNGETRGRAFCTTAGAAVDFMSEDLRRLIVNASYFLNGLEVPADANVEVVDPFHPSFYGFIHDGNWYPELDLQPQDFGLGQSPRIADPPGAPEWPHRPG